MAALAPPLSAVHRGLAFEQRSLRVLQSHLSMSLHRVGGPRDGGIDLRGWWWLPPPVRPSPAPEQPVGVLYTDTGEPRRRIRVIAQCKAESKKMGPSYVREMEGVWHTLHSLPAAAPAAAQRQEPCVALLISQSSFTRATMLRAMGSHLPFMLLHLPPLPLPPTLSSSFDPPPPDPDPSDDHLGTAMWNAALSGEDGLLHGEAELRWERKAGDVGRPGLWWAGRKLRNWVPPETELLAEDWEKEEGVKEEEEELTA